MPVVDSIRISLRALRVSLVILSERLMYKSTSSFQIGFWSPTFHFPLSSSSMNTSDTQEATHTLDDGVSLSYALHLSIHSTSSSTSKRKLALVAHPWGRLGGSKNDHMVVSTSRMLQRQGYDVIRYDSRGAGESEGSASWT